MSYNFLNSFTNRLASAIAKEVVASSNGNEPSPNQDGDFVVAVCMAPSDHLVATLLAIWKAGAAYLPLDVTFPLSRIEHIVQESRPVLVIHDDDCECPFSGGGHSSSSHSIAVAFTASSSPPPVNNNKMHLFLLQSPVQRLSAVHSQCRSVS